MTRHTLNWMALCTAVALALPGIASAHHTMMKDGVMVDQAGMTLYTFDKDSGGKSMCNDECAKNWPPLMVKNGDMAEEGWSQIERDDGLMQWAYKGKPVYTFVKDKKAGDMTGDGMKDVWHVIK
ncbi:hypothetical protein K3F43_16790 [Pseudomonas tussilaginis]|uniref:COG4315 family predicted lipoprotein n=1 Tax=unclassified Pseudomonas TaxID=196821 RepID=UPI000C6CCA3D|nr:MULTISPECIES: hypothetical protein [unclassified Pseudomonas]QYX46348.1 hypothetical protein K3F43_16790 [Pseudomonas sp. S11A 273]